MTFLLALPAAFLGNSGGHFERVRQDRKHCLELLRGGSGAAGEIDDAGLKELMIRLRDHELYHADVFSDLLKDEE